MAFRITGVSILRNYLRALDPTAIVNDEETANFTSYRFWKDAGADEAGQRLVVVDSVQDGLEMLPRPGTYLVITNAVEHVRSKLGRSSNAVVVGDATNRGHLARLLEELFQGIEQAGPAWTAASVTYFSGDPELRPVLSSIEGSLGHPIALFDADGRLVEAGRRAEKELGGRLANLPPIGADEVVNEDDYPVIMGIPGFSESVVCPLRLTGGSFFLLIMFDVQEDSRNARVLIYSLSPLVRQLIGAQGRIGGRLRAREFLSDAISGRWSAPAIVNQQADRADIRIEPGSRLVTVGFREDKALYSDVLSLFDALAWVRVGVVCIHDYEVVVLSPPHEFDNLLKALSDLLRKRESVGPACGVSLAFDFAADLALAHRQCIQAVRVGRQADPKRQIFRYEGVMGDDLVREARHHMGMEPFRLPSAEAMLRHDLAEGSEYALTFYVWLRDFQNLGRTASDLFVHRNTVAFRIKRAEKLFGIDSGDYDQMNDLRCALMVMVSEGRLSLSGLAG